MTPEEACDVLAGIYDQHTGLKQYMRAEPYSLLADSDAADKIAVAWLICRNEQTVPITGAVIDCPFGILRVVRVPDTGGKPLVVDAWGKP